MRSRRIVQRLFSDGDRLRPGERAMVMCLAVDRDQAKIILDYTRAFFSDVGLLKGMVFSERPRAASNYRTVSTWRWRSPPTIVPFVAVPSSCAILDEVAFLRDEASATPDIELFKALEPATATLSTSMIVGIQLTLAPVWIALPEKFKKHYGRDGRQRSGHPRSDPSVESDRPARHH